MDLWHAFILALIQGVTEFLPISSSAHLILVPLLTDWEDQGLVFDVAVHFGSLLAVLVYYRETLWQLISGFFRAPFMNSANVEANHSAQLAWQLVISTLPIMIVGVLFNDVAEKHLRSLWVIGLSSIVFGVILLVVYQRAKPRVELMTLTFLAALIIGLAQILAIIPGASRSGITMTAGLLVGLSIRDAAKYSFLLSIPTILGAAIFMLIDDYDQVDFLSMPFVVGIVVSALSAYACIDLFIRFVSRVGMTTFVIYRCLLGILLIGYYLFG